MNGSMRRKSSAAQLLRSRRLAGRACPLEQSSGSKMRFSRRKRKASFHWRTVHLILSCRRRKSSRFSLAKLSRSPVYGITHHDRSVAMSAKSPDTNGGAWYDAFIYFSRIHSNVQMKPSASIELRTEESRPGEVRLLCRVPQVYHMYKTRWGPARHDHELAATLNIMRWQW